MRDLTLERAVDSDPALVAELQRLCDEAPAYYLAGWPGMRSVRIGVIETNRQAFPFWHKMGFVENGERYQRDGFIADVIILEKRLP